MSWIYIIGVEKNPVKIGIATDLRKRLGHLQIGCPDELIVHHTVRAPTRNLKVIEGLAHRRLHSSHRRGEWFNVDADDALAEVRAIADHVAAQESGSRGSARDEIYRIGLHFPLDQNARSAMKTYRDEKARSRGCPIDVEGYVARSAGHEGLLGLRYVASQMQQGSVEPLRYPASMERAMEAAAAALNAAADFYAFRGEQNLLDEIQSFVA